MLTWEMCVLNEDEVKNGTGDTLAMGVCGGGGECESISFLS